MAASTRWISPLNYMLRLLVFLALISLSLQIVATESQFRLDGSVLELDDSNFDAAISSFDYVFVDFYAPWCGHCKRLNPELDKAAPVLAGLKQPIVVGKVNADKYKNLASKHDIDGYPSLKIFVHGVPTDYFGPRKADLLVQYLTKFVAPDVTILDSDSAIKEFIREAGANFPVFFGFGLSESVISNLAVKYKKKAWFSVANDFSDNIMSFYNFDKVPALVAIHPVYNEQSIFYGPFEEKFLEDYIKQSLLPLVLPINEDSLNLLKDDPRKVFLAIVDDEVDEKSQGLITALKAAASANRDLVFGYFGVKQWEDFAESFEVDKKTQLPKMVVWDGDEVYSSVVGLDGIEETDIRNHLSRFLEGYKSGNVVQKRLSGPTFMGLVKSQLGVNIILILVLVVMVILVMMSMLKEEHPSVGSRYTGDASSSSTHHESRGPRPDVIKED